MNKYTIVCITVTVCWMSLVQVAYSDNNGHDFNEDISNENFSRDDNSHHEEVADDTSRTFNRREKQQQELKRLLGQQLERERTTTTTTQRPRSRQYESDEVENYVPEQVDEDEEEEQQRVYDPYRDNFYDRFDDGTYVYGYSLPNGVRRYERSFYSEQTNGIIVEGFYTTPHNYGQRTTYELNCYRSDNKGYRILAVEFMRRPPNVRRDAEPGVDCLNS